MKKNCGIIGLRIGSWQENRCFFYSLYRGVARLLENLYHSGIFSATSPMSPLPPTPLPPHDTHLTYPIIPPPSSMSFQHEPPPPPTHLEWQTSCAHALRLVKLRRPSDGAPSLPTAKVTLSVCRACCRGYSPLPMVEAWPLGYSGCGGVASWVAQEGTAVWLGLPDLWCVGRRAHVTAKRNCRGQPTKTN